MHHLLRLVAVILSLTFAAALPRTAVAQDGEVSDASRNAARDLAKQGRAAYKSGDYQSAQDLFARASALVKAPTLSIYEARALEKLGRLVEAEEAYQRTIRFQLESNAPRAFKQAVDDARTELAALQPRIARLRIVVDGPGVQDAQLSVTMDGVAVPKPLLGVERPVDPGEHEVVATNATGEEQTATVTLEEGAKDSVTLTLEQTPVKLAPVDEDEGGSKTLELDPASDGGAADDGSTQRVLSYVALGVGVLGVGAGVATGLIATNKHKAAEDSCPNMMCVEGSQGEDDLDQFRRYRTFSTIGYIVGGVGIAGGLTLLLTAPSGGRAEEAALTPLIGIDRVGIRGRF